MSSNGFKGHENGKQNDSDEAERSSSDSSEVEGFYVVKNSFPRVTTVEDATDGSRLIINQEMMSAEFQREQQNEKKKESRMTRKKSYEEKQKAEKVNEPRNTPSVKRESQGGMQTEDDGALKRQLMLSKTPKSEVKHKVAMCGVHGKRCKESRNAEFESKKLEKQVAQGTVLIDTYPRAPTEGLPGFSQSAIMQEINLCDKCDCTPDEQPCMQCRGYNWHCQGTCTCCEVQRNLDEAMKDVE